MEDKKNFITNILYLGCIGVVLYLAGKYILPNAVPFIVGFLIAYFSIKLCNAIFKNDNKPRRAICLVVIYLVFIGLIVLLTIVGVNKLGEFFRAVPRLYTRLVEPSMIYLENELQELNNSLPVDVQNVLNGAIEGLFDSLKSLILTVSTALVKGLTSVVTNAPDVLISIIVTIISSCYFCFDYTAISSYLKEHLPKKYVKIIVDAKSFCENNLFKVIRSYMIMMGMTMVELFIGFEIFGIENAGALALIISIVDILPVLGVGTVLIPWGVIALITKDTVMGIEILGLYLVITSIRNVVESKLVGGDLGLHPLATLIAMILGLKLFGLPGLFAFPLVLSFFVTRDNGNELKETATPTEKEIVVENKTLPVEEVKIIKKKASNKEPKKVNKTKTNSKTNKKKTK
ncbi:MAG: sporulation integral membrane protein YtvI [Erysipelotrichaceae bacterium]|nr:sporulation integral membrane protein YtvI [Erysipelotrichaceae bacterium]